MPETWADALPDNLYEAARALGERGRPDLGVALLDREGDLTIAKADLLYLDLVLQLDDHAALQAALHRSIERLPERSTLPPAYVRLLCQHAQHACDEPRLERLLQKTWKSCKADPELMAVHRAFRRRLQLRNLMRERAVPEASLISLGLNCMPWDVPSRWGLRRPGDFVTLRSPFDNGVNKFPLVLEALQDDFARYCGVDDLQAVESQDGHLTPLRKDVRAVWNHHTGRYWVSDDFQRLRQTMAAKAQMFREGCRRDDAVFLVSRLNLDHPDRGMELVGRLNRGLERFTGRAHNRLMFLGEYVEATATRWLDDWTVVIDRPLPHGSYVWYVGAAVDSDEGLAHEQGIADEIAASLSRWGLTRSGEQPPALLAVSG